MDFESPDVEKEFPGLYASESMKKSQSRDSDFSDEEKLSRKDLLGKKKERRESKKDKGYVAFEGESSADEIDETKSPSKSKKNKVSKIKFGKDKKEKQSKVKEKENKEKKEEKEKIVKKESKEVKKEIKDSDKAKDKKSQKTKRESKILKIRDKKKKSADQEVIEKPIFGVPLQIAVERSPSHDGIELPVVVRECIDYIEEHGLTCEGIYKISGLKSKLPQLKSQYNRGEKVYLYEHEPHIVANLLKQFLRDLPEPILTSELIPKFEEAAAIKSEQKRVETLEKLLTGLPNCNKLLLSWVFVHMLHVVNLERRNKMNLQNVSIVLSPTMQISHHVLHALFAHSTVLFKGVELKKYVPPIEVDSSRLSLELPDSPSALADELSKQENILSVLHDELNTGLRDKQKEEQLWEIQRVVTQLKRKLRFLKQVQDASKSTSEDMQLENNKSNSCNDFRINTVIQQCPDSQVSPVNMPSAIIHQVEINTEVLKQAEDIEDQQKVCDKAVECKEQVITVSDTTKENSDYKETETDIPLNDDILEKQNDNSVVESEEVIEATSNNTSVEAPETDTEENIINNLIQEEKLLLLQQDELVLLHDELKRKVNSEKAEIERLQMEITEYQQLYKYKQYSFDSTENSSSESDDSSASNGDEEEESGVRILQELIKKSKTMEVQNFELSKDIQREREACIRIKVLVKTLLLESEYFF